MLEDPFSLGVNANHQRGERRREAERARAVREARTLQGAARSDDRRGESRGGSPRAAAAPVPDGLGLLVRGWILVLRGRPAA